MIHSIEQSYHAADGYRLAYHQNRKGQGRVDRPGFIWLGGYASDMTGTKATYLHEWAISRQRAYTRFDYAGHGQSGGHFEDGTIGSWTHDALTILDDVTTGPQVLVGSSMGAWIACLLAKARPERLAGLVLVAPAADFTQELLWPRLPEDVRTTIKRDGKASLEINAQGDTMTYTKSLFDDGENQLVLDSPLCVPGPVMVLQGMQDDVVPWQHALRLAEHLSAPDVVVTLRKQGDHRLSMPADLALLESLLAKF